MKKLIATAAAAALSLSSAQAALTVFDNQAAFDAAAAGITLTTEGFDNFAPGTDLTGINLGGVTIISPDGNSLDVVRGADTFTTGQAPGGNNSMPATSGANILSPGGVELVAGPDLRQQDTIELLFDAPVSAVSFDYLFQSLDGFLFSQISVFDAQGGQLAFFNTFAPSLPMSAGGPVFLGFVSDSMATDIARIVISEFDNNASFPDSNTGLDTLRFESLAVTNPVPVPAAGLLILPALGLLRRRRA